MPLKQHFKLILEFLFIIIIIIFFYINGNILVCKVYAVKFIVFIALLIIFFEIFARITQAIDYFYSYK